MTKKNITEQVRDLINDHTSMQGDKKQLARRAKISTTTLAGILHQGNGMRLDTAEDILSALGYEFVITKRL